MKVNQNESTSFLVGFNTLFFRHRSCILEAVNWWQTDGHDTDRWFWNSFSKFIKWVYNICFERIFSPKNEEVGGCIAQWYSTGLWTVWSGVRIPVQAGSFLLTTTFRPSLGPTQPPIQWIQGVLPLGVKWPGREADHSPPSSAEVKNAWSYIFTPPVRLHGVMLS
jgi:hypothetical protein